jgi:hypothetical protein
MRGGQKNDGDLDARSPGTRWMGLSHVRCAAETLLGGRDEIDSNPRVGFGEIFRLQLEAQKRAS